MDSIVPKYTYFNGISNLNRGRIIYIIFFFDVVEELHLILR